MRNRLLFIVGFVISFSFSLATLNFVLNFTPATTLTRIELSLPKKDTIDTRPVVYTTEDLDCLQRNIFFEARNQKPMGMAMIAIVTLQRTKMPEYPSTICGVVYQRWQFSWTAQKHKINMKNATEAEAWHQSEYIARDVLTHANLLDYIYKDVAYYHTTKIHPKWANKMQIEFVLQDHIFYSKVRNETPSFVLR